LSQANVDVVRRLYDAAARRDDVIPFEVYAEDIIWDISNSRRALLAMKPVYHGHEGVRQYWRETTSAFGEIDFEVEELIDAGDQVLAVIREREVGRASGAPVEATHLALYTLSGGKVTQLQVFDDRQQAIEAARLAE
jgi:ketosteroid isomerase-like protein